MSAGLNLAQTQAVHHISGPSLVLAGAGSGKTRVITHKIAHLIGQGMAPGRIAAITFTNKAAAEMRERAKGLIGKAAKDVLICTFHALGVRMVREDGQVLGLKPNFSILDSDDVLSILKDCGGTTDTQLARQWQWTISGWKNMGLNSQTAAAQVEGEVDKVALEVMARYEERLSAFQSVDFDDLVGLPLTLLSQHAPVREKWQARLGHVLVDEYQDTNATQYELLKLLVGERGHFTAVGDDDQSIYGWRGATLENLKKLPQDFPALRVIKLEQNYRSTSAILRAANNVIGPNPKLFPKTLYSELGEGEPVRVVDCDSEEHEAERAVARIQGLCASVNPTPEWRDFAILYRANHQAKALEKALRRASIPYKVSGGTSFFDRSEIRDLCAWFRLWSNEDDDPAFLRAISAPRRGIGHQTLAQLGDFASQYKCSMYAAMFNQMLPARLSARALGGLAEFGRLLNDLQYRARHALGAEAARQFLKEWLEEIGYENFLLEHSDTAAQATARWGNVQEFCDWMAQRAGGVPDEAIGGIVTEAKSLLEVAQTIALLSTISEQEKDQNVVTLSTLHASKGLEWPHVILAGVNEGVLPFQQGEEGVIDQQRLEEERRLMYVGITRAQRTLAVSWTRRRKKGRDWVATKPSRFIGEMNLAADTAREDPRAKLRALREEFARKAAAGSTAPE
ncbi:ATP-dependent DNA helicase Rep [Corticibacter populi]|uniref:ATP-dependent DNA helicase Rep n=1 Tax=Corticibacter populi TaxID=1550736 RepID=A0A3M6QUX7_9BURK|nr:UvrD-helicase domain-containing protein [Corticibacter populi]RMX06691.1 ATP-dependent DNA helicase Rep [Corticibacter populi]RZS31729.1 ATP-dependent DNA helicase Rep [Corticibacter populi]